MRYHPVGSTDIKVSEIGFGCWTMGGPNWSTDNGNPIGWGDVDYDDVKAGIKAGLDAGVTHFDNADAYGNGKAERMLARVFKDLGVKRDSVVIATKVGHFKGTAPHAYEPHVLVHQCEQSLRNLGIDCIDIYYLHHDNWAPDGEPGNLPEAAEAMHKLQAQGKIRAIGQSAYSEAGFVRSVEVLRPVIFQSWANMLADNFLRPGGVVPALLAEHHISFVGFSPLAQGLLLDKFDPENPPKFDEGDIRGSRPDFGVERLRELKPRLEKLKARYGSTVPELASAACRFVTGHPNVCSAIPGFRNERQAACNVKGGQDPAFTPDDLRFCRELFSQTQIRG